jgi:phage shock protein A
MRPPRGIGRTLKGLAGTLLAPAENPRENGTGDTSHLHERIERVRRARSQMIVARQRLEHRLALSDAGLDRLTSQAREALVAGRDDLARLALQRRRAAGTEHQALGAQLQAIVSEAERLALVEQHLVARLDAWAARREILAARLTAAEIQAGIEASLTGAADDLTGFDAAISQTEDALHYLQARASAIDQLTEIGVLDPFDSATRLGDDPAIEADLATLRASIDA